MICGYRHFVGVHHLHLLGSWIQFVNSNYTGCGRKNAPILEGHSFGWGARTMVGARRRIAVYVPFSMYTMRGWKNIEPLLLRSL